MTTTFKPHQFTLSDAREFIESQLDRSSKDEMHLTMEEYRWFMAQLIQLEQAEQLREQNKLLAQINATLQS